MAAVNGKLIATVIAGIVLVAVPFVGTPQYFLHILITILIWSFCYTGWSLMGRFGLVSLGHGAFMSIGAYGTALLWNHFGLTPWLGVPISLAVAAAVAFVVGYPCFRFRIVGHYFALVTLALSEVVRLVIIAERDNTGGSLGYTPERYEGGNSLYALQAADKETWYLAVLAAWAIGLLIWRAVDRSMTRYAMDSIAEDEDASAAAGIWVSMTKLRVTVLSAVMTGFAGVLYAQYQMFVAPDTVGGVGISLQIVFATVAGGMYVMLGPTVGAVITILLAESLRVAIGTSMVGLDTTIYGLMLVLFIIFLPKGVLGEILARLEARRDRAAGGEVTDAARRRPAG
jgi:branched-chain amino acid transport system permease protein